MTGSGELTCVIQVRRTQRAIKQVLTERYYSWDEARNLARDDPEVDLSGEGLAYTPSEDAFEEAEIEELEKELEETNLAKEEGTHGGKSL
jgi:large subunit ribosomal protein L47